MTSTTVRHSRIQDLLPHGSLTPMKPFDTSPITGVWGNTNQGSWGFSEVTVTARDQHGVDLQLIGGDPVAGPHDWGRVAVERLFTDGPHSDHLCGYIANYEYGHARTQIQANTHLGLAVIAALTTFTDGSGRASYLSREWYHRRLPAASPAAAPEVIMAADGLAAARGDDRLSMLRFAPDPTVLESRWRNLNDNGPGVTEIDCVVRDGDLVVRATGAGQDGPIDWGETVATVYNDISASGGSRAAPGPVTAGEPTFHYADVSLTAAGPAFWATFDLGFARVELQGRINLGVLVVAEFTEFRDDSGRADYYCREVFIRQ